MKLLNCVLPPTLPARQVWLCSFALACCSAAHSPAVENKPLTRFSKSEIHMAVDFEIVVYAADQNEAERAFSAGFARVAALNQMLSDYDAESELSRLSATSGSNTAIKLSEDLSRVLQASQTLSETSGGAFDVTVGPLTKLWRRARRQKELPGEQRIAEAKATVGYQLLKIDSRENTALLLKPGMRLDLGGIAKGFAADEALKAIQQTGVLAALVRASGDIVAGDPPPDASGWKVGLAPLDADAVPTKFISLANAAVSTSGDSRQHLIVDGRRYSHLIDPRTGSPVEGRSSVSIIAPTGTQADGMASAVSVLGRAAGIELVEKTEGVAAFTLWQQDEGGQPAEVESKRFREYVVTPIP